jgi:hypothetical protein
VFAISLYASFGVGMVGMVALIPWSLQRFTRGQLVLSHDGLSWTLDGHGGDIAFARPFELARFSGGEDPSAEVPGAWLCLELRQEGQAVTVSVRVPPKRVAGLPVREGHPRGHEPRWLGVLLVDEIERRARSHQAGPVVPVAAGQAVLPAVTDGLGPGGRLA